MYLPHFASHVDTPSRRTARIHTPNKGAPRASTRQIKAAGLDPAILLRLGIDQQMLSGLHFLGIQPSAGASLVSARREHIQPAAKRKKTRGFGKTFDLLMRTSGTQQLQVPTGSTAIGISPLLWRVRQASSRCRLNEGPG